ATAQGGTTQSGTTPSGNPGSPSANSNTPAGASMGNAQTPIVVNPPTRSGGTTVPTGNGTVTVKDAGVPDSVKNLIQEASQGGSAKPPTAGPGLTLTGLGSSPILINPTTAPVATTSAQAPTPGAIQTPSGATDPRFIPGGANDSAYAATLAQHPKKSKGFFNG